MNAGAANQAAREPSPAVILGTVSMCTMLYALTVTIVNVVLPQLQGAFSATPDQVAWVVTLNIVATAVVTPMSGWFVARWGRRKLMTWCIIGFAASTVFSGLADSLPALLVFRVGQGAFGAPLVPLSQAILIATYPPERRAMAQGVFGMSVVIGPALAPAIGGYLAEAYGWRWVFWLMLPIAGIALAGTLAFIRDPGEPERTRLDWTGFLLLAVAITSTQLIMDRGERLDWYDSPEILVLTALLLASFYVLVVHTATSPDPFIKLALFRDRNFTVGLFLVGVFGMLNFTPIVLFPPMLQNLKGYPDSLIGILLAMRGAGMAAGFFIASRMGRLDPRIGLVIGLGTISYSGWMMAAFNLDVAPTVVAWTGMVQGFGSGLMWVALSIVAFATLPPRLLPDGSAIFHLLRNFGSSIFISLSVTTALRTGKVSYAELTESINPFNEMQKMPGVTGAWDPQSIPGLAAISAEIDRQAQMIGYTNAFFMYAIVSLAALPLLLLVRIKP